MFRTRSLASRAAVVRGMLTSPQSLRSFSDSSLNASPKVLMASMLLTRARFRATSATSKRPFRNCTAKSASCTPMRDRIWRNGSRIWRTTFGRLGSAAASSFASRETAPMPCGGISNFEMVCGSSQRLTYIRWLPGKTVTMCLTQDDQDQESGSIVSAKLASSVRMNAKLPLEPSRRMAASSTAFLGLRAPNIGT
ncbi:MAG TPA: hypothetical protein VMW72_04190 [Sedimentisphaerales bacterium]|nr:hypothetical protein [Sedimentisphaerales bacterium]